MIKGITDEWRFHSACSFLYSFPDAKETFIKLWSEEDYNTLDNDDDFYDCLFTLTETTNDEDFIIKLLEAIPDRQFICSYDEEADIFRIIELVK